MGCLLLVKKALAQPQLMIIPTAAVDGACSPRQFHAIVIIGCRRKGMDIQGGNALQGHGNDLADHETGDMPGIVIIAGFPEGLEVADIQFVG